MNGCRPCVATVVGRLFVIAIRSTAFRTRIGAPRARIGSPSEAELAEDRKWRQIGWVLLTCVLAYAWIFYSDHFTASGNFEQGLALEQKRKCTEAIVKLDRALSFDPDMVAAYHVRGICHWRLDHVDQALADFSATVRLKPDYTAGYASRGVVHRHKGNLDAALADWDMAIRLDPARAFARMRRAEALRERDDARWRARRIRPADCPGRQ